MYVLFSAGKREGRPVRINPEVVHVPFQPDQRPE